MINNHQPTCSQCFPISTPATHYWDQGLAICHRWLCKSHYQSQQIQWIFWEEQKKQALAKYLADSEQNTWEYLKKNRYRIFATKK